MAAPSPYETDVQPTDNAKAFAIGQSLSRVHFHLVQSVFLDDYLLAPIPGAVTAKRHGCQWRAAAMSIRARRDVSVDPKSDRNQPDIDAAIDAIKQTLTSLNFVERLQEAEAECARHAGEESCETRDQVQSDIVHLWFTPLIDELQEAASYGFSREQLVWMKLGRVIDEGLCRPDVVRFLSRPEGRYILRIDPYSAAQRVELAQLPENWLEEAVKEQYEQQQEQEADSIDADVRQSRRLKHLRGFASRQPGDLWPKSGWSDDVRRCWALAKIDVGHLILLDELLSSKGSKEELAKGLKENLAEALSSCVSWLSDAAHSAALLLYDVESSCEASEATTRRSTDFRSVLWFGTPYSFTAAQALVVKLLYENWQKGTPDVSDETLLYAVDPVAPPSRLRDVFRGCEAWGKMIVRGNTRGTHRLAKPT